MLYESSEEFMDMRNKRITLMGMSNVGKTRMAAALPRRSWFHYSVDYRLATAYLREPMLDVAKMEMMKNPYLATHLRDDALDLELNAAFSNLTMVSHYLGKLGDPGLGGLPLKEFQLRQSLHKRAEISAMLDLPAFVRKAVEIFKYPHFVCDSSGSLCEIVSSRDDDAVLDVVAENTLILYIRADETHERRLAEGAEKSPKPLYYRPEFLEKSLVEYMNETGLSGHDQFDPDAFVRWMFVRLLEARKPRYARIARFGYVVSAAEASTLAGEADLFELVGKAIDARAESERRDGPSPYSSSEGKNLQIGL